MRFTYDYDIIQINTVKQFAITWYDSLGGTPFHPIFPQIEIGHFCNEQYIKILLDPMIKVSLGQYVYETLITSAAYPVNQLFFVYYSGLNPLTTEPLVKEEKFRTIGAPLMPQANIVNFLADAASNHGIRFNNGLSI